MKAWLESSAAERSLSGRVIPILQAASLSESEICTLLEGLPLAILNRCAHVERGTGITTSKLRNRIPNFRF
jgi:hypothetical protein